MQWFDKIDTCFKRDLDKTSKTYNCILPGQFTRPEFEMLKDLKWEATEKVDGECTSIHLVPLKDEYGVVYSYKVEVHGKTDKACMRAEEVELLQGIGNKDSLIKAFTRERVAPEYPDGKDFVKPEEECIIFGETYGKGMQKGGGRYCKDHLKFICFDVKVGDVWLKREAVEDICSKLGIEVVPYKGELTLEEAVEVVKEGFPSKVAEDPTLIAEGLVLRAPQGLRDRLGGRLITKIKYKDFRDLENKLKG